MNNITKSYIGILVVVLAILAFLEINKTPVINWSVNYDLDEKSPFGLYVFNEEANGLFDHELVRVTETPYTYLPDSASTPKNYLIIERDITKESFDKLLTQVNNGSDLFWATTNIPYSVEDTLGIRKGESFGYNLNPLNIEFADEKLKQPLILDKTPGEDYIAELYSTKCSNVKVLAYFDYEYKAQDSVEIKKKIALVKIKLGKGNVFIFNYPIALTNYYLLKPGNDKIIPNIFSYMPKRETIWFQEDTSIFSNQSPMRFILQNKSLKCAWYIILASIILFAFFTAKRKQRIIPIKEPVINKSVEFVKNIGNLYLQEGNDKDMAHKKATYFLQKVRTELYIPTDELDDTFARKLQLKTNQSKENITEAIRLIKKAIHPKAPVQQEEFIKLNKLLDEIYQ